MYTSRTIIFWGAGATRALGIRTTADQEQFISLITGAHASDEVLEKRIENALDPACEKRWRDALLDLITILGDTDAAYNSIGQVNAAQLSAMRRNWRPGADNDELLQRIIGLRLIYDWPTLKSVVRICPGSATGTLRLNDLFNVLDMHISSGVGVRAPASAPSEQQFFDTRRLIGAKNALLMLLIASFYIDYQVCIEKKCSILQHYYDFAVALGHRMQQQGKRFAANHQPLNEPTFYQGDVTFVSLNYDPIALWMQFLANRELNKDKSVPRVGTPALPLHLFHDFGHLIPARRIGQGAYDWPWYPLNEAAAQRLNEGSKANHRVRLTKFLFPHGCLCWRECPDCGKLSAYHGDEWSLKAASLFPPPPLRAFDSRRCRKWIKGGEHKQRNAGRVDARTCLHCGTLTYAHHTQVVMQSSFKPRPPSFIEEIQRDLRATTMQADHIIFMGYSLPPDDVTYRAFFAARCQRSGGRKVRCTVVGIDSKSRDWYKPNELDNVTLMESAASVVKAAQDIFGKEHVRFYGGGVPDVFLDGGTVTDAKLERLLTWG